jgi:hypothetical protein
VITRSQTQPGPGYDTVSAERVIAYTEEGGFDLDDVLAYELATKSREEVLEGLHIDDECGRIAAVVRG